MNTLEKMASGIAHEINNPLTIILNKAQQLKNNIKNNKYDIDYIEATNDKIFVTATRISKIIKGLSHFSRDATNDLKQYIPFKHIIDETLDLCYARFESNGIFLKLNILDEEVLNEEVLCNFVQIEQVLLSLLNNAFDAVSTLDERWVELRVEKNNDFIEISIIDSGTGISNDIRGKIMRPFFTTKEIGKGTGIGLSISQGIMKSHGGELVLSLDSARTKFMVKMPTKKAA
jgi:C4-dicarboxylate-specific signal transduction histidine kinase